MERQKRIFVYADWIDNGPKLIGTLYAEVLRGKEMFSFSYDKAWLIEPENNYYLDPSLSLYEMRQFAPKNLPNFGIFSDSCPDRWGRLLMKRREALLAREERRKPKQLLESDFLLGVHDQARMGALRFALEEGGPFLANDTRLSTPPWTTLRNLEAASYAFEQDESGMEAKWLNQLLAPGSSLGGARPKATVLAPDGSLWIAKFPSKHDEYNAGAWEKVVHDLAVKCNLNVPAAKLETFSKNGGTFIVKRFDRDGDKRIHFASAMTLLGKTDGASASDGSSYLDLVSFIKSKGAAPKEDLRELWKRIVFSMAVSNNDDHLRNHGFILTDQGWRLSPMYDVNPNIYGDNLSLNVSQFDSRISFSLALETAKYYGLEMSEAIDIIDEIKTIVHECWQQVAIGHGLSLSAIEYMRPAFTMEYKE